MICPKCNIRYETGKFCPKCGTALTEENQIAVLKADASLEEKAVVESQIPEIIVPSIEVISSIGKADCDFTNVEQRKKWYIPAVILLLILILFMGYYLGHSELEQPENIDSLSSNISIASLLIEGVRGEELDSRIKYADLLKSKMDAANLNFFQIDSIYYDSYRKKIVYNLSSPLGRTSLLVKPIITVEKNELKISLQSPTLGKWQIPFPGF